MPNPAADHKGCDQRPQKTNPFNFFSPIRCQNPGPAIGRYGLTILLVEQNASLALGLSHRAYILETGNISLEGHGHDLLADPRVQTSYLLLLVNYLKNSISRSNLPSPAPFHLPEPS
jgi:hypothetical protein